MLDCDDLKTVLDKTDGQPVAYGVTFRDDKLHTTLHFVRADDHSVHMYVYVNSDYLPVGMALVHPPDSVKYTMGDLDEPSFKRLVLDLYSYLCQMSAAARVFNKNQLERITADLLAKATERARELEEDARRKMAA